jgi:hypothetical protein
MLSPSEKRKLKASQRAQIDGRAVVAKSVAGLIVLIGIGVIGLSTAPHEVTTTTASISAPRAETGH